MLVGVVDDRTWRLWEELFLARMVEGTSPVERVKASMEASAAKHQTKEKSRKGGDMVTGRVVLV